jgi:hypothetical protein
LAAQLDNDSSLCQKKPDSKLIPTTPGVKLIKETTYAIQRGIGHIVHNIEPDEFAFGKKSLQCALILFNFKNNAA